MKPLPRNLSLVVVRKYPLNRAKKVKVRTICEVIRELHRAAAERDDTLGMHQLEEAHDMAKRMQMKLVEYGGKRNDPVYLIANDDGTEWLNKTTIQRRKA